MRTGALAGLRTLRTTSACWKPPKEPRSASTWCQGTPRVFQGMARNFDAEAVVCQKEKSLPRARSETRRATAKRCPCSAETLRTKRLASENAQVKAAALSRPGEVGTPNGLRSTVRFCSSYDKVTAWLRSICENRNVAAIDPPTDRS